MADRRIHVELLAKRAGRSAAELDAGSRRMGEILRRVGRSAGDFRLTITADTSAFGAAMMRAAAGLEALQARARVLAGGNLLQQRLRVDVDAFLDDPSEWISPVCRGFLCSSCPGLECHHRCHPKGHVR